jgi:hypothetical protein
MTRTACIVAFLTLAAGGLSRAPQQPVFSARTSIVRVDVLVTERGQPVKGLRPSDFDVRDIVSVFGHDLRTPGAPAAPRSSTRLTRASC